MTSKRIIVSLDFDSELAALGLASRLAPERCCLKVGKQLFTRSGPALVRRLVQDGFDVFLDLKFHDIPATVAAACMAAADLGVWMINVHAAGGRRMLDSARAALAGSGQQPLLIAVTVLTSLSAEELHDTGIPSTPQQQVLRLARLAHAAGLDGVVCSARELGCLRQEAHLKDFKLVTPGIRPAGARPDDQRRVLTPAQALAAGSDYLVIGRPITQAADPLRALLAIEDEIRDEIKDV